jgi:hypothetical protein
MVPADAGGAVTVAVKRLDGTAVTSGAATDVGVGQYTFVVPPSALLDTYTVDWTGSYGGVPVTVRDYLEVVGGFLFTLTRAYGQKPVMDPAKYPLADVVEKRIEVEGDFEGICRQAFVPRFARERLSGNSTPRLGTTFMMLRTVRAVTVNGVAWSAPDVAAVGVSDHGILTRPGGAVWPSGVGNIVVEYEHGWDYPPPGVDSAGVLWLRNRLGMFDTGVPYRATSFQAGDGGVYRLSTPSRQRTGIPDVDAVLERYTRQRRAVVA